MKIKRFFLYGIPKSFLLKLILALLILLIGKNVFAAEQNVTNKIDDGTGSIGKFYGDDVSTGWPIPHFYNVNTRYNGTLNKIVFYLSNDNWSYENNKTYTITLTMATNDWRNHFMGPIVNQSNCNYSDVTGGLSYVPSTYVSNSFQYISMRKIKFSFKTSQTMSCFTKFTIYSGSSAPFTGQTNFQLSSVVISTSSPTPTSIPVVTPTPSPTPQASNKDIINNANQNTQDIINNNNNNSQSIIDNSISNTTDIIDNNNYNNQQLREEFNTCRDSYNKLDSSNLQTRTINSTVVTPIYYDGYLQSIRVNGTATSTGWYYIRQNWNYTTTEEMRIIGSRNSVNVGCDDTNNHTYYLSNVIPSGVTLKQCYLRIPSVQVDTLIYPSLIPNRLYDTYTYEPYDLRVCQNKFTEMNTNLINILGGITGQTSAINGAIVGAQQGIITNANSNQAQTNSKLDDVKNQQQQTNQKLDDLNNNITSEQEPTIDLDVDLDTNSPVSGLLTMPLTLLNKVLDLSDDTCQPYVLPFDFSGGNNTITFPCINLQNYLGSTVYNVLDTILCFFFAYEIGMMCITIYEGITSLKDGFDSLYTPKHGPSSYTPKHGGGD